MFDREQYIGWLNQQQQMYNPHLRELNTEDSEVDGKNEPIDLQEGLGGVALGFGALGAAGALLGKRSPTSGKREKPKSIIGSAIKGAAIGAGAVGASKYLKSAIPKYSDRAPRHAERAAGRHLRSKAEREAERKAWKALKGAHGPVRWPAPHVGKDKIAQLGRTPEFVSKGKRLAGLGRGRHAARKISAAHKPLSDMGAKTIGDAIRAYKNK
jgi:hypothetical protein